MVKFSDVNAVITETNQSEFGLGGSVWSTDIAKAEEFTSQMETGTVWINSHSD